MEYGGLQKLSAKEKIGFFAFLFFACAVVILGFRGIGNAIKGPFAKSFLPPPPTVEEVKQKQVAELKSKDTDKDGLSDYDEIYVYNTSPYLADTDSDSLSDKDELLRGTDPNCPEGKTCFGTGISSGDNGINQSQIFAPALQVPTAGQLLLQTMLSANPDPQALRNVLEKNGVSKQILDSLDDDKLIELAKQAAGGAEVGGMEVSYTSSTNAGNLKKISPAERKLPSSAEQLRAILRSQGVSEDQLQKIDDETLLKVYQEVIQASSTSSAP